MKKKIKIKVLKTDDKTGIVYGIVEEKIRRSYMMNFKSGNIIVTLGIEPRGRHPKQLDLLLAKASK